MVPARHIVHLYICAFCTHFESSTCFNFTSWMRKKNKNNFLSICISMRRCTVHILCSKLLLLLDASYNLRVHIQRASVCFFDGKLTTQYISCSSRKSTCQCCSISPILARSLQMFVTRRTHTQIKTTTPISLCFFSQ